jgi:hypothetical protein
VLASGGGTIFGAGAFQARKGRIAIRLQAAEVPMTSNPLSLVVIAGVDGTVSDGGFTEGGNPRYHVEPLPEAFAR